jgi:hypothetical protein
MIAACPACRPALPLQAQGGWRERRCKDCNAEEQPCTGGRIPARGTAGIWQVVEWQLGQRACGERPVNIT